MKHNWEQKKFTDICIIQYGYPFDSECFTTDSEGLPLVRIRDVVRGYSETYFNGTYPDEYIVHKGDYLIGMDGEFNIAQWKSDNALLNQRVCRINVKNFNQNHIRYIYYYLIRKLKEIENETPFVTVKHLSAKRINQITLPTPPLSQQQQIVSELDKLNLIIEKKKQQVKELDNLAQSIFYDMFGDPVENEKGWQLSTLGDLSTEKLSYGSGASAIDFNGDVRYVRITDIDDMGSLGNDLKSPDVFDEKYLLNEGDILFARSGATVGKTYCHSTKNGKSVYAGYLIRMVPDQKKVLPKYIFYYTKSNYYKGFVLSAQNAVAQPNINAKQYSGLLVQVPPLPLQQAFASKVEAIERQKELINQSIQEAQTLFDSRMEYYFGE